MDSILLWTLLALLMSSVIGVFLTRRRKDICLKDFNGYMANVQFKDGKRVWGRLRVDSSGLEFSYRGDYWDEDHIETSFILFKEEFGQIYVLFRFLDELSEKNERRRQRRLQKSYHPWLPRRIARKIRNFFNAIKDAISEAIGATIAQAKTSNQTLQTVAAQQKYINKAQGDLIGYVASSYDPILERHIGNKVVLEITTANGVEEHVGVFREYSSQFLEVMDVSYKDGDSTRVCDIIAPRAQSFIRHSAEQVRSRGRKTSAGGDAIPYARQPESAAQEEVKTS